MSKGKAAFQTFSEHQAKCCELLSAQRLSLRVTCFIIGDLLFISVELNSSQLHWLKHLQPKKEHSGSVLVHRRSKFVLTLWVLHQWSYFLYSLAAKNYFYLFILTVYQFTPKCI